MTQTKDMQTEITPAFIKGDEKLSKFLGGIGSDSLHAMRKAGLPYHKFGGIILYYPDEVTKWVLENFEQNTIQESVPEKREPKVKTEKHVSIKTQFRK